MMLPSNPGVLDHLIRDRQEYLRRRPAESQLRSPGAIRVRIGHALIAVGTSLSGERVERTARHSASAHAA
jgi:hypothetical protein